MRFEHTELSNGMSIVGEIRPVAASMAAGFFVRTGSRDETPAAGVSHFLEHMMFKGTERRSVFDINREFDEMGALYNAFTSEENTVYFAAVLPEFQERLLDLLADMLRPALRQEDFETEKKVILEEIALYQDRPQYRLYEKLMAEHFGEHPLSHSVLGTQESVQALGRDDMLAYFSRRYSPNNVTLVGVGNFDWDRFVSKADQMCGWWSRSEVSRDVPDTAGTGRHNCVADDKLLRQHVGIMSAGPNARTESRYAAHLLATVLGDATGSRLFYALVEPAIAEEASCSYEELDGTGIFVTFLSADPARASKALRIAREVYAGFMAEGPSEGELVAAKNKVASGATLKGELPLGRLAGVGFDWIYRRSYRALSEHVERILAVSADEVRELANDFDLTAMTIMGLGPNQSLES